MMLKAKSVHIFAWPFEICCGQSLENIRTAIKRKGWRKKQREVLDPDEFMLKKYLSSSARSIFCEEKDICEVYEFLVSEDTFYIINDYELPIYSLELHLYHMGSGVLFIHLKNEMYKSVEDIRKINDYGRRISIPFLPDSPDGFILCADRIGVKAKNEEYITDFRKAIKIWSGNKKAVDEKTQECLEQPADFLYQLVGCTKNQIETTSDDRMFTFALVRDEELSEKIKESYSETNEELLDQLYKIIFVDPDDATCQNLEMKTAILKNAVYERWSDYGTLYGVTNFSMLCITSETEWVNASVVRPFLIEYKYLVSLVLAQKTGIAMFSEMAGAIVKGVDDSKLINRKQAKRLINLQEQYITFKNQVLILEVSSQEQGIELYQLLRKQMQIEEEQAILDEQLESLYEVTNVSNGNRIEKLGIVLAGLAIAVDIILNLVITLLGK